MSSKSPWNGSADWETDASTFELESNDSDCAGLGGTQPAGGATRIIVPHFGHANSWLTAEALETFNRAAHDLQIIENGCTNTSIREQQTQAISKVQKRTSPRTGLNVEGRQQMFKIIPAFTQDHSIIQAGVIIAVAFASF
ncbi:MAG: hypothetical protein P8J27_02325 [Mariniblastus sp.]|nr:hypothetical protein [Mariniblastus sp.]